MPLCTPCGTHLLERGTDLRYIQHFLLEEELFEISMNPREWMARFGHNILLGDGRVFRYKDKEFENWIYQAFEALSKEEREKLWKEFLTDSEIQIIRELFNNP